MNVTCPYCDEQAPLTHTREIYGRDYGWAYRCVPCDAYVGCHNGTTNPKGTPANFELRELRKQAHETFDLVWKGGNKSRPSAYKWLAGKLDIEGSQCHIGMFTVEQCTTAIDVCNRRNQK